MQGHTNGTNTWIYYGALLSEQHWGVLTAISLISGPTRSDVSSTKCLRIHSTTKR
jgi:hypothetical protein